MRKVIILSFFILVLNVARGQFLTQSADGKGSIVLPLDGAGVSADIGKTEVVFGLNNYSKVLKDSRKFLFGVNLTAKSADGLAGIFSSGELVPESSILAFTGFSFSNKKKIMETYEKSEIRLLNKLRTKMLLSEFEELKASTLKEARKVRFEITDEKNSKTIFATLEADIPKIMEIDKLILYVNGFNFVGEDIGKFKAKWLAGFTIQKEEYTRRYKEIQQQSGPLIDIAFDNFIKSVVPIRSTIFLQGGINGRVFTRFLSLNTPDFSKSFQDTLFKGGTFGLGVNVQVANYWLGVTYSYVKGDNFVSLKNKEYTLRTTDISGNQELIREKKIPAFSGDYSRVEYNQLNIDIVGDYRISDTSRVLANIYARGSLFSRDTSFLKNYLNVGAGIYFIGGKGKFLGGLYVELPDVNNNLEKAKSAADINIKPPFKKLTFGIVTKFNLSSVFGWTNRPVRTE